MIEVIKQVYITIIIMTTYESGAFHWITWKSKLSNSVVALDQYKLNMRGMCISLGKIKIPCEPSGPRAK